MDFSVIVPARLGAARLPAKPLADIGGRPLIVHVLERARQAGAARVVAAVDDDQIAAAATAAGFEAVRTGECSCGSERVAQAAAQLELEGPIVNLQGDEPFIDPDTIAATARLAAEDGGCATAAAALAAQTIADASTVRMVIDDDSNALYFSRAPIPHGSDEALAHIGIYAFASRQLLAKLTALPAAKLEKSERLEQLRWLAAGQRIRVLLVSEFTAGIDTPEDLAAARNRHEQRN
ncbi:MAG: 3-deoxy-manno-octulosonate cytidylyltransferase [Betaproteobacteria bacterium]|nr:3-deoxy-manno-octulosonate cytidylyltransferase [Betaproteobacteria bacterium]